MILKKLIFLLGVGILAPQFMYAQTKPANPVCIPAILDCAMQTLAATLQAKGCNKHEQSGPIKVAATTGTGIEQPCKAEVTPESDLK